MESKPPDRGTEIVASEAGSKPPAPPPRVTSQAARTSRGAREADGASDRSRVVANLREQIRQAKRASIEAQIAQAAATYQFERCIQLRQELDQL